MKIAVFLDVDETLTRNFIQQDYAKILGCENAYRAIESDFQAERIDSAEFGQRLIKLFAEKGFTEETARRHFHSVALQEWTDELLKLSSIDTYLVSSGPSYYIDELARKYRIPENRVLRSEYSFNGKTELIESCKAVDAQDKQEFVKGKVKEYGLTLGVGTARSSMRLFLIAQSG